ncbi:hypothetical protein ACB092_05G252500 [Castanea dentata]
MFKGHHKAAREKSKKKKIVDKEGIGNRDRLRLNFEVNKEDRLVFLDVAPMKYLQPTIQILHGTRSLGDSKRYHFLTLFHNHHYSKVKTK